MFEKDGYVLPDEPIYILKGVRWTGTLVHKAVSMSGTGDLLEHRTDGSDAYDTLYIGCEKFPQHDVFAFDAGDVM